MKEINVNDTVYYRSPYPEGSVLKVFVKELEHLIFKNNEKKDVSGFRFIVEPIETIVEGKDHHSHPKNDKNFLVVEEFLHHDLNEALDSFNKTKEKRLELNNNRLKTHNKILTLLENISDKKEFSQAETDTIDVRGQTIKKLKDLDKTYYSFFDWEVARGLDYQGILEGVEPLVFEVEIGDGTLNKKTSELSYNVFPAKGFGKDKNEISTFMYSDFQIDKLEYLHNTYESALKGLKLRIIELIENLEK